MKSFISKEKNNLKCYENFHHLFFLAFESLSLHYPFSLKYDSNFFSAGFNTQEFFFWKVKLQIEIRENLFDAENPNDFLIACFFFKDLKWLKCFQLLWKIFVTILKPQFICSKFYNFLDTFHVRQIFIHNLFHLRT